MSKFNPSHIFLVCTTLGLSFLNQSFIHAQNTEFKQESETLISLEFPNSSNNDSPPKSTVGGGRRSSQPNCFAPENDKSLTALIPYNSIQTASSQPTFFVYIPKTLAPSVKFFLKDQKGTDIDYQEILLKENTPGIIEINLSPDKKLEANSEYTWKVNLNCQGFIPNGIYSQEGTIIKTSLEADTESQLQKTNDLLEKAEIYAEKSIWPETLNYIAKLKDSQPDELKKLLDSVGLGQYSNESFLPKIEK